MLVSHTKKFIFTKTVKTGGTSAEVAFQQWCLPPGCESAPEECEALVSENGIVGARGRPARDAKWRNHMSAREIKEGVGEEIWKNYFKFTVVRNPFDKVVSWFHFQHPDMHERPKSEIFDAFNRWIMDDGVSIPRDRNKYTIQGRFALNDVARYEALDFELNRIASRLHVHLGELPQLKTQARGSRRSLYPEYYGADSRARVEELFDYELGTFGYGF